MKVIFSAYRFFGAIVFGASAKYFGALVFVFLVLSFRRSDPDPSLVGGLKQFLSYFLLVEYIPMSFTPTPPPFTPSPHPLGHRCL